MPSLCAAIRPAPLLDLPRFAVTCLQKFNRWLDTELAKGGPQTNLLVYPEGKRSQQTASLPLKRGMLRYAFTRKLPVQVGCLRADCAWGSLCCWPCRVAGRSTHPAMPCTGPAPACCHTSVPANTMVLFLAGGQVVVTAYKEEILNERRMWTHFGRTLVTGCSGGWAGGVGLAGWGKGGWLATRCRLLDGLAAPTPTLAPEHLLCCLGVAAAQM